MYETFGFGVNANGKQRFQLFIPDKGVDPNQYTSGGPSRIVSIKVVGDFLKSPWNVAQGLEMTQRPHPNGILWEAELTTALPEGFYEYKYVVTFQNSGGNPRWVADPCAKLCGTNSGNSAFVVGGPPLDSLKPLPETDLSNIIAYEVMVDDATAEDRGTRAPLDALWDRLQLVTRDIPNLNAIELMPLTACPDNEVFSWGYDPFQLFALDSHYVQDPTAPADRRARLARLVKNCHDRGLRVFLDIVLQHVKCDDAQNGFPYHFLWQDPADSPFTGAFTDQFSFNMQPLDYNNACVLQFAVDVCCYWLGAFGIDGLRFDQVSGYYNYGNITQGAPALMAGIRAWATANNRPRPLLMLEDTWGYDAINRTNQAGASACWLEPFRAVMQNASQGNLYPELMRVLQSDRDFDSDKGPVIYIENHDHSTLINAVGGLDYWWRTQPAAIALFTSPGLVLVHNGQERGLNVWMPDDDSREPPQNKRVQSRPISWRALSRSGAANQLANLYGRLAALRSTYAALRGPDLLPLNWPGTWDFDAGGRGFNVNRRMVIYQRGTGNNRIVVALNFGDWDQNLWIPLPIDGTWRDVLNTGVTFQASGGWAKDVVVNSHWGRILVFGAT